MPNSTERKPYILPNLRKFIQFLSSVIIHYILLTIIVSVIAVLTLYYKVQVRTAARPKAKTLEAFRDLIRRRVPNQNKGLKG